MTLGEIKLEALRLMFMGGSLEIDADQLIDYLGDETFGYYLTRMPGAINRALSLIERYGVLPIKRYLLRGEGCSVRFDLPSLIPDFYDIERIVYERDGAYDGCVDYCREGDTLVLLGFEEEARYTLLYRPTLARIGAGTPNENELEGVTEAIASLIPYAIKGEVFRDDEPDEADAAMGYFLSSLEAMRRERRGGHTDTVVTVLGGGFMA